MPCIRKVEATKATSAQPAPRRTARPSGTAPEAHGGCSVPLVADGAAAAGLRSEERRAFAMG